MIEHYLLDDPLFLRQLLRSGKLIHQLLYDRLVQRHVYVLQIALLAPDKALHDDAHPVYLCRVNDEMYKRFLLPLTFEVEHEVVPIEHLDNYGMVL